MLAREQVGRYSRSPHCRGRACDGQRGRAAATATFLPGMAARLDPTDPVDKLILDRMDAFTKDGSGYLAIQNTRPQTIGYGLADSPLLQ